MKILFWFKRKFFLASCLLISFFSGVSFGNNSFHYAFKSNNCAQLEPWSLSRIACGIKIMSVALGGMVGSLGLPLAGIIGTDKLENIKYNPYKESIKIECQRILDKIRRLSPLLESS